MTKRTLGLAGVGVGIVAMVALLSMPLSAGETRGEHKEAATAPASTEGHGGMQKMHMKMMGEMLKTIDKASKAVEAGQKNTALAELKKARQMVVSCRRAMSQKIVNIRCPIMGDKLNLDKVKAKQTRMFEGRKVGFCCSNCPAAWDKLSAKEKAKKLAPTLAPQKAKPDSEGSGMKHHDDR